MEPDVDVRRVTLIRTDGAESVSNLPKWDVLELCKLWNAEIETGLIDLGKERSVAVSSIHDLGKYALLDPQKLVSELTASESLRVRVVAERESRRAFNLESVVGKQFRALRSVNMKSIKSFSGDSSAIYIYGPNNSGKTSFLNLVRLWYLCFRKWILAGYSSPVRISPQELKTISSSYTLKTSFMVAKATISTSPSLSAPAPTTRRIEFWPSSKSMARETTYWYPTTIVTSSPQSW